MSVVLISRIEKEIKDRLNKGEGETRIVMKSGTQLDIVRCIDDVYLVTYPPYYTKKGLSRHFFSLNAVAKFIAEFDKQFEKEDF